MNRVSIICLLLAFSCAAGAQVKSAREQDDLFGPVNTVRTETQRDGVTTIDEVTYNRKGNKTREKSSKADGSLISTSEFEYDDDGHLKSVTSFDSKGTKYQRTTYRLISVSPTRVVEETILGRDESVTARVLHLYDAAGRGIETKDMSSDGKQRVRILASYDSHGKPAEVSFFSEANSLSQRTVFVNDSKGNPMEMDFYGEDGSLTGKMVYSGDIEKGSDVTLTEYDGNGNLTGKTHGANEFDSAGNWTKRTLSKWNPESSAWAVTEVTRRTIAYY